MFKTVLKSKLLFSGTFMKLNPFISAQNLQLFLFSYNEIEQCFHFPIKTEDLFKYIFQNWHFKLMQQRNVQNYQDVTANYYNSRLISFTGKK